MDTPGDFWAALDALLARSNPVIDRPRGSPHPVFSDAIYPLDYGYLPGTVGGDGAGVDAWLGAAWPESDTISGVICTVDLRKRDAEIKLLVACSPEEAQEALTFHNDGSMRAIYVPRPPSRGSSEDST